MRGLLHYRDPTSANHSFLLLQGGGGIVFTVLF